MRKFILSLPLLVLTACTTPAFVVLHDKEGNIIGTVPKDPLIAPPETKGDYGIIWGLLALAAMFMVWQGWKAWTLHKRAKNINNPLKPTPPPQP